LTLKEPSVGELKRAWRIKPKIKASAVAIAHWNGKYGVAKDCMEIIEGGEVLSRVCGESESSDVSVYKGTFLFGNYDGNVYMLDEDGSLVKKFHVGLPRSIAVTTLPDGFVSCGEECALFDLEGNELWKVKVGYVANGPTFYEGYLLIPDHGKKVSVLLKDTGMLIMDIPVGSPVYDLQVCERKLAIAARGKVALLDISDMGKLKDLWIKSGIV
jgi:outer membrane protein assembly factor BamB